MQLCLWQNSNLVYTPLKQEVREQGSKATETVMDISLAAEFVNRKGSVHKDSRIYMAMSVKVY